MTYLIPTIYTSILLVFCMSLCIHTLSHFESLHLRIQSLSQADAEFLACAQRKANFKNIEDSYRYLERQYPHLQDTLFFLRNTFQSVLLNQGISCTHKFFENTKTDAKYQHNLHLPKHWPNWIYSAQEAF